MTCGGIMWVQVGDRDMFRGLAAINIDVKGRVTIPANYREKMLEQTDGELVLTIDTEERCLLLYPAPQWQQIEEQVGKLPSYHPASRRIQRLLIGHAHELDLDRHGRILLPPLLREYAGLDKTVILVGQGKKFELWSEQHWQSSRDQWIAHPIGEEGMIPPEMLSISL